MWLYNLQWKRKLGIGHTILSMPIASSWELHVLISRPSHLQWWKPPSHPKKNQQWLKWQWQIYKLDSTDIKYIAARIRMKKSPRLAEKEEIAFSSEHSSFVTSLLKKPTWYPYGTNVGTMWVPCRTLVGPCGNHVGTMWDQCEKLLRDAIGNHVGPM